MAVIKGPPSRQTLRRFRGVVWVGYDRGIMVAKKWPRKRPGPGTPSQQAWRKRFGELATFINQIPEWYKEQCQQMAQGTDLTWRDIAWLAASGQLYIIDGINNMGADTVLDEITTVPGSLIIRTTLGWKAVIPGTAKQVLTWNAITGLPNWESPGGGTGGDVTLLASVNAAGSNIYLNNFAAYDRYELRADLDAGGVVEMEIDGTRYSTNYVYSGFAQCSSGYSATQNGTAGTGIAHGSGMTGISKTLISKDPATGFWSWYIDKTSGVQGDGSICILRQGGILKQAGQLTGLYTSGAVTTGNASLYHFAT